MHQKLGYLLLAFQIFSRLFAQNPSDVFNLGSYNQKYLEHLIKEKVDEVRVQHHLQPLYNDSILYLASGFHASYLLGIGKLSHQEPENPTMEQQGTTNFVRTLEIGISIRYFISS